jgi:hypothetical protein
MKGKIHLGRICGNGRALIPVVLIVTASLLMTMEAPAESPAPTNAPNPRFTPGAGTDGMKVVRDNLTGLMWTKDASNACGSAVAAMNWGAAITSCNNLVYGGYDDWRLPSMQELYSLINFKFYPPMLCDTSGTNKWSEGNPFTGIQSDYYWSHDPLGPDSGTAWAIYLFNGFAHNYYKTDLFYVWPVRGGR